VGSAALGRRGFSYSRSHLSIAYGFVCPWIRELVAIHLKVADTQKQIDDAIRVRHEVFVVEDGNFGEEEFPDGRMTDHIHACPGAYNIVAYDGSEAVATIRLTKDSGAMAPAT